MLCRESGHGYETGRERKEKEEEEGRVPGTVLTERHTVRGVQLQCKLGNLKRDAVRFLPYRI